MTDKKTVGRNVTVAIGALCVALTIGLVGMVINYAYLLKTKNSETANTVDQIKTLNSQISGLQNQIASKNSQISALQSNFSALQSNYQSIQIKLGSLQSVFDQLNSSYQQLLTKIPPSNEIIIESVNFTSSGGNNFIAILAGTHITDVVVRNLGENDVTVTSLKLYYNGTMRDSIFLQASENVSVVIHGNSTSDIQPRQLYPSEWNSSSNFYYVTVETKEGYTATSDPLPLLGNPPPPLGSH